MARRPLCWCLAAVLALCCLAIGPARAEEPAWTIVLQPKDYLIGASLSGLKTRHRWVAGPDGFDVAVSRRAVPIPSPKCRMDYLILTIPVYYPENPNKASKDERRAVYDGLVALKDSGSGSVSMRVEAPFGLARAAARGQELTSCSLFIALPLSVQFSTR